MCRYERGARRDKADQDQAQVQLLGKDAAVLDQLEVQAAAAEQAEGEQQDATAASPDAQQAAVSQQQQQHKEEDVPEEQYSDDEFGFVCTERMHTLKSFSAYGEWAKRMHFSAQPCNAELKSANKPRPKPSQPPPAKKQKVEEVVVEPERTSSRLQRRAAGSRRDKQSPKAKAAAKAKVAAAAAAAAAAEAPVTNKEPQVSIAQLEAEFWRIVERPDPGRVVETLYGQDLDSGRHGSGFPLPPWRGIPTDARTGRHLRLDPKAREYSLHQWNINNMPRCRGSVLRYVTVQEPITGVMVPWLYVGSCLSAFCWHIEDHALYSVNYLHMGAPKVWYGVPAHASEAMEAAMKDALPHLFEADPNLLHRLVTMVSPNELKSRGIPVSR